MSHGEIPYIIDPDRLILDARLVYHSHEVSKVAAPGMAHQNLRLLWSCSHHLYPWPSGWSFQLLLEMEVRNDLRKYQFWSNATMMRPFKMKRTSIHIWFCPKPGWSKIVSNHLKSDFLIEIVLLRGIPYTPYLRPVLLWPLLLGGIHDACTTPPILDRRCPGWQFSQCSKHIVDCDSQPRILYG